jgi:hypothetical protein
MRLEAFEQLARREHHLIGGLAAATASAHAVGQHAQQASMDIGMGHQHHLVLLVLPVTAVDAGGGLESVRWLHGLWSGGLLRRRMGTPMSWRILSERRPGRRLAMPRQRSLFSKIGPVLCIP